MRFVNEKEVLKMAKKLKKAKKGMNPKVKFTLVNSFSGLISNQAVIDGSRGSPWWVAVIFFLFASFLPLIPTFAQLSKMNGATFISGLNYGLDDQLARFAYREKINGYEFKVESGKLHYYENFNFETHTGTEKEFINPAKVENYFADRKCEFSIVNSVTNQFDAKFYFWSDENLIANVNEVTKQTYLVKGNNGIDGQTIPTPEMKDTSVYLPNIIIFTPTTMAVALYKANTNTAAGTSYGGLDWLNTRNDIGLVERLLDKEFTNVIAPEDEDKFVNKFRGDVLNVFKGICTETYLNQKNKTKWANTGIYLAIYSGVIIFLGLIVFILTRGKNNPYKFLNIWECQKISWWAAASPAILGTLMSLIFSGNTIGQMAFILLVSLRVMWLSMKQLRPMIQ